MDQGKTMSIQNISGKSNTTLINVNAQKKNQQTSDSLSSPVKQDSVTLTDAAKSLANVEQRLASLPDVNKARVDHIKQSINEDSYSVNSEKIAAKILAMEDLITSSKDT